jgi:hypothetical protein
MLFAAELMGAKVDWDAKNKKVGIQFDEKQLIVTIGKHEALVNGEVYNLINSVIINQLLCSTLYKREGSFIIIPLGNWLVLAHTDNLYSGSILYCLKNHSPKFSQ